MRTSAYLRHARLQSGVQLCNDRLCLLQQLYRIQRALICCLC